MAELEGNGKQEPGSREIFPSVAKKLSYLGFQKPGDMTNCRVVGFRWLLKLRVSGFRRSSLGSRVVVSGRGCGSFRVVVAACFGLLLRLVSGRFGLSVLEVVT